MGCVKRQLRVRAALREPYDPILLDPIDVQIGSRLRRTRIFRDLTLGELALLLVAERGLKVDLVVVKCEGWKRADWWDATGLLWVNPSPNLRSLPAAGSRRICPQLSSENKSVTSSGTFMPWS